MLDIKSRIEKIKALCSEGSPSSLTYAALECRLTLEAVCYGRLLQFHKALDESDLGVWRPQDVMRLLVKELEPKAASSFTLSVASGAPAELTAESYAKLDWVELGKQSAIDINRLSVLWQALANLALHVRMPASSHDRVEIYGKPAAIKPKIDEAIAMLEDIARGNLLMGSFSPRMTATCPCGAEIVRTKDALSNDATVSCLRKGCVETFICLSDGDDLHLVRREIAFPCPGCGLRLGLPEKPFMRMKRGEASDHACPSCGVVSRIEAVFLVSQIDEQGAKVSKGFLS